MYAIDLLGGQAIRPYAASLCAVVLLLMLYMAVRLYNSRRKSAYLAMTVSLAAAVLQQLTALAAAANPALSQPLQVPEQVLKSCSFILINMSIYRLYNPRRVKTSVLFYGCLALGAALPTVTLWAPDAAVMRAEPPLLSFAAVCFLLVAPRVAQSGKYRVGLAAFAAGEIASILNVSCCGGTQPTLVLTAHFAPLLYAAALFMLLFERIVELLQLSRTKAITDGLTGLFNRRYFDGVLQRYVRLGLPVTVVFADIDNFKKLNDAEGHDKGDETLRRVAAIMQESSEEVGVCGRYGGEEMVVLVVDPDTQVGDFTEALRCRIEAEASVTVSIGYSKYRKGMSAETLVKQADEAMYQAKTTGKNKVVKYGKRPVIQ